MPLTNHGKQTWPLDIKNGAARSIGNASVDSVKCAAVTVTMMLAQHIVQQDWPVDGQLFVVANSMNVWQTIEVLSGLSVRRRYHYEGYNDTQNSVRTLTPSWRRDSFAEKTAPSSAAQPDEGGGGGGGGIRSRSAEPAEYVVRTDVAGVISAATAASKSAKKASALLATERANARAKASCALNNSARVAAAARRFRGCSAVLPTAALPALAAPPDKRDAPISQVAISQRRRRRNRRKAKLKKHTAEMEVDSDFCLSPDAVTDLVQCTFNLPRISACLERLMGTNVVRLTDRKYMKELRERIDENYRMQLLKRIRERELKEVERERILIIEGKTDKIPEELSDDPIFLVNKSASVEIQKKRAKLKTIRERNSERLRVQGIKWERDRLQHEEEENRHQKEVAERRKERKEMEDKFQKEDNERGMDLLRIYNEDWRACEQKLKEFLERERARMKERSLRVPTPFTSDKLDTLNIDKARRKFRETEQRIRNQLEEGSKSGKMTSKEPKVTSKHSKLSAGDGGDWKSVGASEATSKDYAITDEDDQGKLRTRLSAESSEPSGEEEEEADAGSTISEAKRIHTAQLGAETAIDVERGLLISKEQYENMRYEEDKIQELRQARTMRELYRLAEEIIIGERVEEPVDELGEEEQEEAPPPKAAPQPVVDDDD